MTLERRPTIQTSILLAFAIAGGAARAGQPAGREAAERRWHLTLAAATSLPIDVGGRIALEGPYRLRLTTSLGFLPNAYVDMSNAILVAAGAYNQATAELIRSSIGSGLVWRIRLGWRPFARYGMYFEAGYGLVTLGGGASAGDLIASASGFTLPPGSGAQYEVNSTLHMIDIELGWQWHVWQRRIMLAVAVGFLGTVGSSTSVTPLTTSAFPALTNAFVRGSAAYLDNIYQSYVFTPTISLVSGYNLF
jgi:hypothetical protein